jgi:hypothetical protein
MSRLSNGSERYSLLQKLPRAESAQLCWAISLAVRKALGREDEDWLIAPANVKMRIDWAKGEVVLAITDLCDNINLLGPDKKSGK